MTKSEQMTLEKVAAHAAQDLTFRTALLEAPRAAIARARGINLSETLRIKFIEKGPDLHVLMVLPDVI